MQFERILLGVLQRGITQEWWQAGDVPHPPEFRRYVDGTLNARLNGLSTSPSNRATTLDE